MEICISPKQLSNLPIVIFYLCYFGGKKSFFLLYIYLLFELFIVTFSLSFECIVCGMWHHGVMYSAHVCKCTGRPELVTPCLPSSLFSLSLWLGLSLNLDTLILALLTSLRTPGMQLPVSALSFMAIFLHGFWS